MELFRISVCSFKLSYLAVHAEMFVPFRVNVFSFAYLLCGTPVSGIFGSCEKLLCFSGTAHFHSNLSVD